MEFYATALALADDKSVIVILDVDAIGFDLEWTNRILDEVGKLTRISREHIRFSCSHTHSGPNTFRLATISEGLEMALSYLESLPHLIAGAAWQAIENLQPVRVAVGAGTCDINVNRRFCDPQGLRASGPNYKGTVDHRVGVIRLDDFNEKPIAVVVHYACHPTIMAWQNQWFTPDYPGVMRKVVEQHTGGTCLFLQGAAGDIGPRAGYTGDLRAYRRAGTILGLEVAKVALNLVTLPRRECYIGVLQSGAPIALYEKEVLEPEITRLRITYGTVSMPLRKLRPIPQLEAEARKCLADLEQAQSANNPDRVRMARARLTQANWQADMARSYAGKSSVDWELQCIRFGTVALLSTRGEPFTDIALQIVARSPIPDTFFSGYSNGAFGYIPTKQAFSEGGYEIEASPFAPEAADKLIEKGVSMLHEMA